MKKRGGAGGAHIAAAHGREPALRRIVIFNAASPERASRRCSSRTEKRRKSSGSACNGPRQRRGRRFDMAAPPDPSTSARPQAAEIARAVAVIASEFGSRRPQQRRFSCFGRRGLAHRDQPAARRDAGRVRIRTRLHCLRVTSPPAKDVSRRRRRRIAFKAAEIVYAPRDIVVRDERNWPDWAVDRSAAGNAHRRRRSPVHGARLWRDRRFGANLRQRAGAGQSSLSFRRRIIERRRNHERQSARRRTDGCAQPRRGAVEPRRCPRAARGNADRRRREAARRRRSRAAHRGNLHGRTWRRCGLRPDNATPRWPWTIAVTSPQPVIACLGSQYAGWSLAHGTGKDAFFALGSGPARALAQKEAVFKDIGYRDEADVATLVIESGRPPPPEIVEKVDARLRGHAFGFDGDLRADAEPGRGGAGGRAGAGSGVAQGA